MERFMLWNFDIDPQGEEMSFWATKIQVAGIRTGTREMIDQMLSDAGVNNIQYTAWTIDFFRCNYFSSPGEAMNLPESWMDTWRVSLRLAAAATVNLVALNQRFDILRTYARDATWGGVRQTLAPYVIVAQFYGEALFARAIAALSETCESRGHSDPEIQDLIDGLRQNSNIDSIALHLPNAIPLRVEISLGSYDVESFAGCGTRLARSVIELVNELVGTFTWDDTTDRWAALARFPRRTTSG